MCARVCVCCVCAQRGTFLLHHLGTCFDDEWHNLMAPSAPVQVDQHSSQVGMVMTEDIGHDVQVGQFVV